MREIMFKILLHIIMFIAITAIMLASIIGIIFIEEIAIKSKYICIFILSFITFINQIQIVRN
jgi:hypothetical protein